MIKQTSAYSPSSFGLRFTLIAALSLANLLRNHSSKFRYEDFENWTLRMQRLWIFEHSYVSALLSWRHSSRLPIMHPIAIAVSTPYLHTKHRNRLHISSLTKHRKISLYWQGVDKLLPRSLGSRDAVQAGTEVGAAFCDYLLLFCKNRLFSVLFKLPF